MLTVEIKSERLDQTLSALHDALIGVGQDGDAATMMADESRRFLKQVINLTPPPGRGNAAKTKGEEAIKRDLMKHFTPVNDDLLTRIGSEFGLSGVDTWLTTADGKHKHLKWARLDPNGGGMAEFHRGHQDRRGRPRGLVRKTADPLAWVANYVVSWADFTAYLNKVLSHLGHRKGGWGKSFLELGGKLPKWIADHARDGGAWCMNNLHEPGRPSITMANVAPGLSDDARIVRDAMRARAEAIGKRIRLIISGYSKDVAQGIRPRKQVQATPVEL